MPLPPRQAALILTIRNSKVQEPAHPADSPTRGRGKESLLIRRDATLSGQSRTRPIFSYLLSYGEGTGPGGGLVVPRV